MHECNAAHEWCPTRRLIYTEFQISIAIYDWKYSSEFLQLYKTKIEFHFYAVSSYSKHFNVHICRLFNTLTLNFFTLYYKCMSTWNKSFTFLLSSLKLATNYSPYCYYFKCVHSIKILNKIEYKMLYMITHLFYAKIKFNLRFHIHSRFGIIINLSSNLR